MTGSHPTHGQATFGLFFPLDMPGRPIPDLVKKQLAHQSNDTQMECALDAYHHEQTRQLAPGQRRNGVRKVAAMFPGVTYETLRRQHNGGCSISKFNSTKKLLTDEEEHVIVDFALQSSDHGFPCTHAFLGQQANAILDSQNGDSYEPVGKHWVDQFLQHHCDRLQTHWSHKLDTVCGQALNPTNVQHWFMLLKTFIDDYEIVPALIYGMDESGFPTGDPHTECVIGRQGTKVQHEQTEGDCENTTVLVTICADRTSLCPTIIFKGKNLMTKWNDNNPLQAS